LFTTKNKYKANTFVHKLLFRLLASRIFTSFLFLCTNIIFQTTGHTDLRMKKWSVSQKSNKNKHIMMKATTSFRPRFTLLLLAFLGAVTTALAAGSINGRVFLDCNRNGIREPNEIGLASERVTLSGTTSTGQAFSRTFVTSADGLYSFNGIPDGTYSVLFTMPLGVSGLSFSPANQGNNDTLDSDVNPNGRTINTLSIVGNTNITNLDAGVIDTEAPQITPLHPALVGLRHLDTLTMRCDSAILFNENSVRVTDNSGHAVSLHFTDLGIVANGDCRRDGFISLVKCVWRAIDTCGNFSEWSLFMRMVDNNPPTILNVPADLTVNSAANIPNVPTNVTAVDACSGAVVPTFQQTENGNIITRRWTAVDNCGNIRVAVQNIRINGGGLSDTCRNIQRDTIRLTMQQGQNLDTCIARFGTVTDWQLCQQSAHIAALLRGANCLRFEITDAQFSGTETVCFNRGNCQQVIFSIQVVQPHFPPCNFLGQRTYTATLSDCNTHAVFCVAGSNDLNEFRNNFSITDNGNPYNATIEGCNFDTIFTYTYFAIPNMGNRPPYRLDYWEFNGNRYSINPLMSVSQLVDSMNIWDNTGNWQLDTLSFSIFGGNPRNNYGDIRITRLENGAIGNMQLNTGLISRGVGLILYAGNHLLVLRGRQTGCADTLRAVVTCSNGSRPVPVAINDSITTRFNTSVAFNPTANDTLNGSTFTVNILNTPRFGTIGWVGFDSMVYIPQRNFCGRDTMTYRVCNEFSLCDTAQIFFNVRCEGDTTTPTHPIAIDDNIITTRNTSITFTPLSNDRINGTLTGGIAFVRAPRHGSMGYASDSTLVYTPNRDYCGRDTFEYRICNERFLCDTATVFITITCDSMTNNLRPDAIDDIATVRTNSPTRIDVLQNDRPNGTLIGGIQIISAPRNGSATVTNNEIIYTSNNGFCNANDTLMYRICNINGCDTAQVVITVNCDSSSNNQNPLAVDDYILTRQNTSITFTPLSNDRINGILTGGIAFVSAPRHGSIGYASDSTLVYTPNRGYCGRDTFEYRICNERFLCDTAIVYITIICDSVTNPFRPNAVDDSITVVQNNPTSIHVLQNDIPNGVLIGGIRIVQMPSHGVATVVNNQIVYTSDSSYCNGNDTLTYLICNASACDTARVVIRVNCRLNNVLDAVNDSARVVRGGAVTINILSNDTFDRLLSGYPSIVRRPTRGRATIAPNGNLIYLADSVFCGGNDTLTYEICNVTACDTAMVVISVRCDTTSGDTSRLIANFDVATTFRNRPVTIAVLANDSTRSGVETMRIVEQTRNGIAILNADRTILYRPSSSFCGDDTLIYEICNRRGCDTAMVFIQVFCRTSLNDTLPLAVFDTISTARATPVEIDVLRNDTLNAPTFSQFNLVSNPRRGEARIMLNNQIRYTPDSSFCGVDSLIYEVCNLFGCDTAIVRIRVVCQSVPRPTDTLPIAVLDTAIVQMNVPRQIDILINDTLRGATQPELIRGAIHGLASITIDNKVLYVPDNNYCGVDTLTYRLCNAVGCDTALVIITIPCGNDLFVFTGFSPNGDVQNEFLRIRGIENYVDSEVTIFNRWGTEVFYTRDYQNNVEKAFIGKWQGKDLPDGTYFCCIRDAKGLPLWLGFIQIRR
jgi:gliding motility-associated-like protein